MTEKMAAIYDAMYQPLLIMMKSDFYNSFIGETIAKQY
jgi:hypothetical protein